MKCSISNRETHAELCAQGCSAYEALSCDLWLHKAGRGSRGSRANWPSAPCLSQRTLVTPDPLSTPDPDSVPQIRRPRGLPDLAARERHHLPWSTITWFSQGTLTSGSFSRPPPSPWPKALTMPSLEHLPWYLFLSILHSSSGLIPAGRVACCSLSLCSSPVLDGPGLSCRTEPSCLLVKDFTFLQGCGPHPCPESSFPSPREWPLLAQLCCVACAPPSKSCE